MTNYLSSALFFVQEATRPNRNADFFENHWTQITTENHPLRTIYLLLISKKLNSRLVFSILSVCINATEIFSACVSGVVVYFIRSFYCNTL